MKSYLLRRQTFQTQKKQRNTCSLQSDCFPKEQVSGPWKSISSFQPLFPNSQGTQVSDRVITKCDMNYGLSLKKKKRWDRRQIPKNHSSRFYSDKILDLTKLLEIFLSLMNNTKRTQWHLRGFFVSWCLVRAFVHSLFILGIYYDFQFCIFMTFLCVWTYVSLCLNMFLMYFLWLFFFYFC